MPVFQVTPRILIGAGTFDSVATEALRLGAERAMVVTDYSLEEAGYPGRLMKALEDAGLSCLLFCGVEPDPSFENVIEATEQAKGASADLVLGLGGGSSMDVAKAVSVMVGGDHSLDSIIGVEKVEMPGIRKILIPTTAGTGSEVTGISVLSDKRDGSKKAIATRHLLADVAVVDPELTLTMPPRLTASSGMDALVHAIEAFTSVNATPLTDLFATGAIELIPDNLRKAYRNGQDLDARAEMQFASLLAGMAFGNAGTTATHAFAYPVGAKFRVPHGIANTIMLPVVMRFNIEEDPSRFKMVADSLGEDTDGISDEEAALAMVRSLQSLISDLELPTRLSEYGITEDDIESIAEDVMEVERILANNPREVRLADAESILREAL